MHHPSDIEDHPFSANDDEIGHPDGSDIPLDVVRLLVTTGDCGTGFLLDGSGKIVCSGAIEVLEDIDEEGDIAAPVMYQGCNKDWWRWRSKCMSYVVLQGVI